MPDTHVHHFRKLLVAVFEVEAVCRGELKQVLAVTQLSALFSFLELAVALLFCCIQKALKYQGRAGMQVTFLFGCHELLLGGVILLLHLGS